jgi:hypothetical protein
MIADKKKRLVKRYFFQVRIKYSSEKSSEGKRRKYKFQKSAEHQSIFSLKDSVNIHLSERSSYIKN